MEKRITYHEAGHAVVDVLLGNPFIAVSMEKKREPGTFGQENVKFILTEGVIWAKEYTKKVNEELLAGKLDLRRAISSMAGPQAEAIIVGKIDEEANNGATNDMNGIRACCRIAAMPGVSLKQSTRCAMELPIIEALAVQAEELLRANWASVEAVANKLNSRKRLTQDEVAEIVKATGHPEMIDPR